MMAFWQRRRRWRERDSQPQQSDEAVSFKTLSSSSDSSPTKDLLGSSWTFNLSQEGDAGQGYDYDFIDCPSEEFLCTICLLVLKNPILTSCCGNHFCEGCIERVRKWNQPCPLCKNLSFTVMLDKFFMRKVHELKVKCPLNEEGCEWTGELGDVRNHINPAGGVCEYVMVQCDYNCGGQVERRALTSHKAGLCPRRPFVCQYCDYQATFEKVEKHWLVCSKYPLECPNGCRAPAIERQHFKEHIEVCPLEVIVCSFHLTGCTVRLPRKDMAQHLSESQSAHLTLIPQVIVNMQRMLAEKDKEIAQLQADMARLTSSSLDKEKRIIELERRVSKTDYTYPPVELIMPDFDMHRFNEDQWFSEPFYTHEKGYKMCLSVFANGIGKGENSHVSVFANLMRGDFDDSLGWPFRGSVDVQLEDDDRIIEETLRFTARSPAKAANRVVDGDRNEYGQGSVKFIEYDDLEVSSSVIFRVCSVEVRL